MHNYIKGAWLTNVNHGYANSVIAEFTPNRALVSVLFVQIVKVFFAFVCVAKSLS
ncbi:hypothetical protein D3C85_269970 [compost metagenome]|jgi:hypothetical protein